MKKQIIFMEDIPSDMTDERDWPKWHNAKKSSPLNGAFCIVQMAGDIHGLAIYDRGSGWRSFAEPEARVVVWAWRAVTPEEIQEMAMYILRQD